MPIVFVVLLWMHPPESISARMDPHGLSTVRHSRGKQFRCLSDLEPRHEPPCSQRCSVGTRIASSVATYPAFLEPHLISRMHAVQQTKGGAVLVPTKSKKCHCATRGRNVRISAIGLQMSAFGGKADMTVCGSPLSRSLLTVKRTSAVALHMSASGPKRKSHPFYAPRTGWIIRPTAYPVVVS